MLSDFRSAQIISDYLKTQEEIFTCDQFYRHLKTKGVKITKAEAKDLLHTSDYVFSLIQDEFITRAGVFTGRWFSFKPTKEEVDKGYFLIGHRCMPFVNPEVAPDSLNVFSYEKNQMVPSFPVSFTMNLAMDVFAFFGEGYILPYIINDKSNEKVPLASVQYELPAEITLTAWPLDKLCGKKQKFNYGDRILCRVVNWNENIVEMSILKNSTVPGELVVSREAIEREEWYSRFENGLLESFDKNGPAGSIEEQLALLFLENQEGLCIKNAGSCEEFLKHTKKIGFSAFGVESRIWRNGEDVPYIGEWNKNYSKEMIMSDISLTFSPQVIDAYLEDNIFRENNHKKSLTLEELSRKIFPTTLKMSPEERNLLLLNIEKRNDILKKEYNSFSDCQVAQIRQRILELFADVSELLCDIGCCGVNVEIFPQQELVILSQLFSHIIKMIEEVENVFLRSSIPYDDVSLSLDGMEETFDGICGTLQTSLNANRQKAFGIVNK